MSGLRSYWGVVLRHRVTMVSAIVLVLALTVPAGAVDIFSPRRPEPARVQSADKPAERTQQALDLSPYGGLGTWIDMFDESPWAYPEATIASIAERGVRTVYLETSNYLKKNDIYKPTKMARLLDAAHAAGLKVVAWYVPGFKNMKKDRRRTLAAINFETATGQRFDSFAMDIEATANKNLSERNARMARLSKWTRKIVGPNYALGGIVPDVQSLFWPGFPYDTVAKHYDVLMPMSYFTYRVSGAKAVKRYIAENFTTLRARANDPDIPIHNIGGIGGRSTRREARAYAKTVIAYGGKGGSYYDFPITAEREWQELSILAD